MDTKYNTYLNSNDTIGITSSATAFGLLNLEASVILISPPWLSVT